MIYQSSTKNSTLIHLAELNDVTKAEGLGESFIQTNIKKAFVFSLKKMGKYYIYVSSALIYDLDNSKPLHPMTV